MTDFSKEHLFKQELTALINRYNMDNRSNTPDFILAEYLLECLKSFNSASIKREHWYGVKLEPGQETGIDYRKCLAPHENG